MRTVGTAGDSKNLCQRRCASRTNPGDLGPAFGTCSNNLRDAAVPLQHRTRAACRDAADGREHRLGPRLDIPETALRVCRTITTLHRGLTTRCEPVEPSCGVVTVASQKQTYPLADCSKAGSTDCLATDLSVVNRSPFDDQVRDRCAPAKGSKLPPEAPPYQRVVEIANMLPFHDDASANEVVGRGQAVDYHRRTKALERLGNAAPLLVNVDDDHGWGSHSNECARDSAPPTVGRFGAAETASGTL